MHRMREEVLGSTDTSKLGHRGKYPCGVQSHDFEEGEQIAKLKHLFHFSTLTAH